MNAETDDLFIDDDELIEDFSDLDFPDLCEWQIGEMSSFGLEPDDRVSLNAYESDYRLLADYMVENSTRVIPFSHLKELCPLVFSSLESLEDEDEQLDIHDEHPVIMRSYGLIVSDDPLEMAFDALAERPLDLPAYRISRDDYAKQLGLSDEGLRPLPDDPEMRFRLCRRIGGEWVEADGFSSLMLCEDDYEALFHWIVSRRSRMISLSELCLLCPRTFASLECLDDDMEPALLSESELRRLYVPLRGQLLEDAFDRIYRMRIYY